MQRACRHPRLNFTIRWSMKHFEDWSRLARCGVLSFLAWTAGCASQPGGGTSPAAATVPAAELRLSEFFKLPVGPRGLEPTDKLRGLAGKRVRVHGYLVQEEEPLPGLVMLTPVPVTLAELADGPADYLPPATLFAHVSGDNADRTLAYRPGLWTLTGTLELGSREEPNGRVSYARLNLDGIDTIRAPDGSAPVFVEPAVVTHGHHH
ncbi:hypothetical protein MCA2188 [Methylococcus capsulatus str. Bath]|uniref:Lipoprotein n=2 Tax=Methylococcus capsulatus TaxID=414 RepID=Q605T8_METCA|nr:hypothetical protein MCA2188 [Methylococcus capsulatus str. Bath]